MRQIQAIARLVGVSMFAGCLLFALVLMLSPGTAQASFCSAREDSLQAAEVIFSGKVDGITRDKGDDIVRLNVTRTWKGVVRPQAVVHTGSTARDCGVGDCGYRFKVGGSYLVFAYEWPAQPGFDMGGALTVPAGVPTILVTDICSRTSLLSAAHQDLTNLGTGGLPSTGSASPGLVSGLLFNLAMAFSFVAAGIALRIFAAS